MRNILIIVFLSLFVSSCGENKRKKDFEAKKKALEEKLAPMTNKEYDSLEQITSEIEKALNEVNKKD